MNRLEFAVEYSFDAETGSVVAIVPHLNYVSSFGRDFAEAEHNVIEAVLAYLEALKKDGLPLPQSHPVTTGTVLVIELVT